MPQPIDWSALVHPNLIVSGAAYSKCAGVEQSFVQVPEPSRTPQTSVRVTWPFTMICVSSVPTAASERRARAWKFPFTSVLSA